MKTIRANWWARLAGVTLLAALGTPGAYAQPAATAPEVVMDDDSDEPDEVVGSLTTAMHLADIGRENKNAEALLLAARLLVRDLGAAIKGPPEGEEGKAAIDYDPKVLLDEARKLTEDKLVLSLIERVAEDLKEKSRGALQGPKHWGPSVLKAGGMYAATVVFSKGQSTVSVRITPNLLRKRANAASEVARRAQTAAHNLSMQAQDALKKAQELALKASQDPKAGTLIQDAKAAVDQGKIAKQLFMQARVAYKDAKAKHLVAKAAAKAARDAAAQLTADRAVLEKLKQAADAADAAATEAESKLANLEAAMDSAFAAFKTDPTKDSFVQTRLAEKEYLKATNVAAKLARAAAAAQADVDAKSAANLRLDLYDVKTNRVIRSATARPTGAGVIATLTIQAAQPRSLDVRVINPGGVSTIYTAIIR